MANYKVIIAKGLLQMRSSERVLAPVTNQILQLVLMLDSHASIHSDSQLLENMELNADRLSDAVKELIKVALQLRVTSSKSSSATIEVACDQLDLCVRNMLLARHNLSSNIERGANRVAFHHHLKELFENIYRVFVAIEDAENNKILGVLSWIKDLLRNMNKVKSLDDLVNAFKQYTEGLLIIFNLIAKQQRELRSEKKRHALGTAALVVKKIAPSVNRCCQACIKYPNNSQAKENKTRIFSQIADSLDEIRDVIQNKVWSDGANATEGLFVSTIDQILNYFKTIRKELDDGDFEFLVETAVRHALSVASLSDTSCEKRKLVTLSCSTVLRMVADIVTLCKNFRSNQDLKQLREDFQQHCEALVSEIHDLERHVNSLVIKLIVDVFKETTEPLERLLRASVSNNTCRSSSLYMAVIQPFYDEFSQHADHMYHVASFVADSSNDPSSVGKVKATLSVLEKLDPDILPAVLQCQRSPSDTATDHLRHLRQRWTREIGHLSSIIDGIGDPAVFVDVTVSLLEKNCSFLENTLRQSDFDVHTFADVIRAQVGLCSRLMSVISRHMAESSQVNDGKLDEAFSSLKEIIIGVKSAAGRLAIDHDDPPAKEAAFTRVKLLERCVLYIKSLLNGETVGDSEIRRDFKGHFDVSEESLAHQTSTVIADDEEGVISDGAQMWLSLKSPNKRDTSVGMDPSFAESSYRLSVEDGEVDVELDRLIQEMIRSAIASEHVRVNLVSTRLIQIANEAIATSNLIIPLITGQDKKEAMRRLVSVVSEQTIEFQQAIMQVSEVHDRQLDNINLLMQDWARNISTLENHCDSQLAPYSLVTHQLVTGIQSKNRYIIDAAKSEFNDVSKQFADILSSIKDEGTHPELLITEKFRNENQRLYEEISHMCSALDTADLRRCRSLCRLWSCNILCAAHTMAGTCKHYLSMRCNMHSTTYADCLILTEQTIKHMYSIVMASDIDTLKQKCRCLLGEMQSVLNKISHSIEPPLGDLSTDILTLSWGLKVSDFLKAIDGVLEPCCSGLHQLAHAAFAVFNCHEEDKDSCMQEYKKVKDSLKADVLSLINQSQDGSANQSPMAARSRVTQLAQEVTTNLKKLTASTDDFTIMAATDRHLTSHRFMLRCFVMSLLHLKTVTPKVHQPADRVEEIVEKIHRIVDFSKILSSSPDNDSFGKPADVSGDKQMGGIGALLCSNNSDKNDRSSDDVKQKRLHSRIPDTPFTLAVRRFQGEIAKWADNSNPVVKAARDLAKCLEYLSQYVKYHEGPIGSRQQLFDMSQQVVTYSRTISKFCDVIAKYSLADWRLSEDLLYHSNQITFFAEQLSMLTNVKRSTSEFDNTVSALAKNGDNLMESILKSLNSAESILLKGLKEPPAEDEGETQTYLLASRWRAGLIKYRHAEINYSDINDLGLRVVSKNNSGPRLTEMCYPAT